VISCGAGLVGRVYYRGVEWKKSEDIRIHIAQRTDLLSLSNTKRLFLCCTLAEIMTLSNGSRTFYFGL